MGSPVAKELRRKLLYFGVLLALFLGAVVGLLWIFVDSVLLSVD
jgi:hypothetical protein